MRALCWHGKEDIRVDQVPDPGLEHPGDILVRVTATAICGSDLHLYGAKVPTLKPGDILGHEFMGEVVETGSEVRRLEKGDKVVVPFTIACGACHFCDRDLYSLCDTTNPNEPLARKQMGHATAGMFGYAHITGGYAGGQAEYVRVPHADVGPLKVPAEMADEELLFLSDIFPTGWQGAENAGIQKGDTVAVWGCGPVGLFAIKSALLQGAERVIAIDEVPERLALAESYGGAETIRSFDSDEVYARLMDMTKGLGPSGCIDAVGLEAHGSGAVAALVDRAKAVTRADMVFEHPYVLQQMIKCCKKGGNLSIPGVYVGYLNGVPMGAAMNKGLTWKMGQTHMQRYMKPLLNMVLEDQVKLSSIITHRLTLDQGPEAYRLFQRKEQGCVKVVMTP